MCHIAGCINRDIVLVCPRCGGATCQVHKSRNPSYDAIRYICSDCSADVSTTVKAAAIERAEAHVIWQQKLIAEDKAKALAEAARIEQNAVNDAREKREAAEKEEKYLYSYHDFAMECPKCHGRRESRCGTCHGTGKITKNMTGRDIRAYESAVYQAKWDDRIRLEQDMNRTGNSTRGWGDS